MKNINVTILIILSLFTTNAQAYWWDCSVAVLQKKWTGSYKYIYNITREVNANRRTEAEKKASFTTGAFKRTLSSKDVVCSSDSSCAYKWGRSRCRRQ